MADPELDALLERAAAGDRDAADVLVRRYRGVIEASLHRRLGQAFRGRIDTEDVVQSTFAMALNDLHSFENRGEGAFAAWLLKIAENRVAKSVRFHGAEKRDVRREAPLSCMDAQPAAPATPSQIASGNEQRDRVRDAVDRLGRPASDIVRLRAFEGLRFREIAERLGLDSPEAARHRYARAVSRLADDVGGWA